MKRKHLVIPDCQVKSDVDISYLEWVGNYIAEKKPDVVVCIGDFADMPSLSSYDQGKKSFEGRRYKKDIEVVHQGMEMLMAPIEREIQRRIAGKKKQWRPELILTLGNHENRINRVVNDDPKLDGTISVDDLKYEEFGWRVVPFLEYVVRDQIAYSHYFTSGVMGRPVTSARQLVQKKHMSAVMGHVQNWEIHRETRADGTPIIGLFCGSCYLHNEDYLGPQGNNYGRGIWMLNEVEDGSFHPMMVTLSFLKEKYT